MKKKHYCGNDELQETNQVREKLWFQVCVWRKTSKSGSLSSNMLGINVHWRTWSWTRGDEETVGNRKKIDYNSV
jgi:hypothetical protein